MEIDTLNLVQHNKQVLVKNLLFFVKVTILSTLPTREKIWKVLLKNSLKILHQFTILL